MAAAPGGADRPGEEGFGAGPEFVADPGVAGLDDAAIGNRYDRTYPHAGKHPVLYVVDAVTLSSPEYPVLVVSLSAWVPAPPFRAVLDQLASIQTNLSISNMDYVDFARAVDADGVFRGFSRP